MVFHATFNNISVTSWQSVLRVNINTPADNRMYPLHLASKAGDLKSVKLLVDYGARIDVSNIDMATPLHIAAQYNHKDIVEYIPTA
jgi:ankyrin repeat protein